MANVWLLSLLSVFVVSVISLVGVAALKMSDKKLKSLLLFLISFSAGALLGDTFIHLLPEVFGEGESLLLISVLVLVGIIISFMIEKLIFWHHCHLPSNKKHHHPFAYINLIGDLVHNFIDGVIIAGAYLVSVPVGISTTIAVMLHEIPQEIGDFGVLIYAGFSRARAIAMNFLVSLSAVAGAILALFLSSRVDGIVFYLVPLAAGNFLYLSLTDLLPEIHKETKLGQSIMQLLFLMLGIVVMAALLLLE
jgi:zinc and cadmium transporter